MPAPLPCADPAAPLRLNLIGPGGVGQTLFRLFSALPGVEIGGICGRSAARQEQALRFIGAGQAVTRMAEMPPADLWFITTSDTMIAEAASELARTGPAGPAMAVHCSGFLPHDVLAPLADLGWSLASAHPVASFADPAAAVAHFSGTCVGIEGQRGAASTVATLMSRIGARPFEIRPGGKPVYHAAAVFSHNFTVALQSIARAAWAEAGVAEEIAAQLNAGLLGAACRDVSAHGPIAALSGPAARGDTAVVTAQGAAVAAWDPAAGEIYRSLSALIAGLKAPRS